MSQRLSLQRTAALPWPEEPAPVAEPPRMSSEIVVAAIAHDMRNLLSGVTLNLHVLDACDLTEDERAGALSDVRECVRRLSSFTSDLMAWAARAASPHPASAIRLSEVVADCVRLTTLFVPGHRCSFDVDVITECVVHGRRREVEIAIVNVLVNAVEANGHAGRVHIALERRGDSAVVRVRDEGPGVAQEVRAKVFEPFFTTRGARGNGIGLAATRSIARAAGGEARLTAAGPGAEFEIELPLAE